jgi:cold shock CspA family protein
LAFGKVKHWNDDKGFGFILADDGESYFAHINDFKPRAEPDVGQRVQFDIAMDDRKQKPRADNVRAV